MFLNLFSFLEKIVRKVTQLELPFEKEVFLIYCQTKNIRDLYKCPCIHLLWEHGVYL